MEIQDHPEAIIWEKPWLAPQDSLGNFSSGSTSKPECKPIRHTQIFFHRGEEELHFHFSRGGCNPSKGIFQLPEPHPYFSLLTISFHPHKSQKRGWTSADRSTKTTLMLTVPPSALKSSTEELTRPTFHLSVPFSPRQSYCYTDIGQGGCRQSRHGFWLRGVQS